jgi:hypothetical protein
MIIMENTVYPPEPRTLLPPLLACLPTAAFSTRAPPALPPLVTPILRQRLSVFERSPTAGSWLKLLNWNRDQAAKLPTIVESMNLEAHPVSGEVEIRDVGGIQYKRLDTETLQARLQVDEFDLQPIYLWCIAGSDTGPGWLLTELKALEDEDHSTNWFDSISEAEEDFKREQVPKTNGRELFQQEAEDEEDDSAYWAAYDNDPGRTPGKPSPVPGYRQNGNDLQASGGETELDYYDRYASEVQPSMDPYDADEDTGDAKNSTLDHHRSEYSNLSDSFAVPHGNGNGNGNGTTRDPVELVISVPDTPHHPHPRSSSQSSPRSIRALEAEAERQSQAEVGIKQHISTDLKSLFRLARSAGITREEFERIVKRQLEVLPFMDLE